MRPQRPPILLPILLLSFLLPWAGQGEADNREQRVGEAVRAMLVGLAGEEGSEPLNGSWHLPAETVDAFGLVLSPRHDRNTDEHGVLVLGVTPGTAAARIGLRGGDRLRAVNGESLVRLGRDDDRRARAFERFRRVVDELESGDPIRLAVWRDDRQVELDGRYRRLELPAVTVHFHGVALDAEGSGGCATLRLERPPEEGFDLYPARLQRINGRQAGATLRDTHYLIPGTYVLSLEESIPSSQVGPAVRRDPDGGSRDLVVQLRDRMAYDIAAALLVPRQEQRRGQAYWEPVVWRSRPEECAGRPVVR